MFSIGWSKRANSIRVAHQSSADRQPTYSPSSSQKTSFSIVKMSSSPPSRSQSETFTEAGAIPPATSGSDQPNLPLLFKYNEEHNAMMSHLDENNENDAVRRATKKIRFLIFDE